LMLKIFIMVRSITFYCKRNRWRKGRI